MEIDLQEWINTNVPGEDLIYKSGLLDQALFMRDEVYWIMNADGLTTDSKINVISTHVSKSITLPVYQLELNNGIKITSRYNFFDWKVSISSEFDIELNFMNLFKIDDLNLSVYYEGFPKELVFNPYSKNNMKKFSFEIADNYRFYTFLWILKNAIKE